MESFVRVHVLCCFALLFVWPCLLLPSFLLISHYLVHCINLAYCINPILLLSSRVGKVTALGVLCCFALLFVWPCLLLPSFLLISHYLVHCINLAYCINPILLLSSRVGKVTALGVLCCFALLFVWPCFLLSHAYNRRCVQSSATLSPTVYPRQQCILSIALVSNTSLKYVFNQNKSFKKYTMHSNIKFWPFKIIREDVPMISYSPIAICALFRFLCVRIPK